MVSIANGIEKSKSEALFHHVKHLLFIIGANFYFYIIMIAIYGFVAVQPFHYQYPTLHAIESFILILILAVLNVGVVLALIAKIFKINELVLYITPPLYCVYKDLAGSPDFLARLYFTFSGFEQIANFVVLFFITLIAGRLLVKVYSK